MFARRMLPGSERQARTRRCGTASPKFLMGGSDEEKFDHPTQKPVELTRRPILNHTKRGELVYEPFLGSGTTLAAAELTERVCVGMELDPKYVDVIVQRWQTLSGKKAKLDGDERTFDQIAEEEAGGRMNRTVPPGDRGNRNRDPRGESRSPRTVPGVGRLVMGTSALAGAVRFGQFCATVGPRSRGRSQVDVWANAAMILAGGWKMLRTKQEARRGRSRAGQEGGPMLRVDPVATLAALGLEGFDGVTGLLHRARHKSANCVLEPTHGRHDLGNRRAF